MDGDGEHDDRGRWAALPLVVVLGVAGGVLVLAVMVLGVVGLGRGAGPEDDDRATEPTTTTSSAAPSTTTSTTLVTVADEPNRELVGPNVVVHASESEDDGGAALGQAVGQLEPVTVLRLVVEGFPEFATARAVQCVAFVCGNEVDVQFDAEGRASFQYLVFADFAAPDRDGACRLDAAPCSVLIENVDGDGRAELITLFYDSLPEPGHVRVVPAAGLQPGEDVTVELAGFAPGTRLSLLFCAGSPADCLTIGRRGAIAIDRAGTATVPLRVPSCPRRVTCTVDVRAPNALAPSIAAPLAFAAPLGADYDAGRVAVGLGLAVLVLGIALFLIRRTDWSAVGEEAAPEIDEAEYADLDALVAEFEAQEAAAGTGSFEEV